MKTRSTFEVVAAALEEKLRVLGRADFVFNRTYQEDICEFFGWTVDEVIAQSFAEWLKVGVAEGTQPLWARLPEQTTHMIQVGGSTNG